MLTRVYSKYKLSIVYFCLFKIILGTTIRNQGAWSLSERSHWSFWLDTICLGENKFGRNP